MTRTEEQILALIPARGGSKGVPRKNVREIGGKPLVAWTVEAARRSGSELRIVLSTDDDEIAAVGRSCGAEVPFLRPAELSADGSTSESVVFHALEWLDRNQGYRPGSILLLQPTSPFRTSTDIDSAIRLLREPGTEAVVSVKAADRPLQWLRKIDPAGMIAPASEAAAISRRQEAEPLYELNGAIYLISTETFLRDRTFYPERTRAYVMPAERSLDIDSELDLLLAELFMRHEINKDHRE